MALILCAYSLQSIAQDTLSICTWNIANLGKSKSNDEIKYMAELLKYFDLVAVQEVSSGSGGTFAVAMLGENLSVGNEKWEYVVSDPTSGPGTERYAFLWKTNKLKQIGKPSLALNCADTLVREPFHAVFVVREDTFHVVNFHAVPAGENPDREIRFLQHSSRFFLRKNTILLGDFNLNSNHQAFHWLQAAGLDDLLENERTTIKMEPKGDEHFASPYDNIFYPFHKLKPIRQGRIDITLDFPTLKDCRLISDHAPVFGVFIVN